MLVGITIPLALWGTWLSLADVTLDTIDRQGNTVLNYACLGAKYETVALLRLKSYDAESVSKRNSQKKLPIDLLWESNEVVDRECRIPRWRLSASEGLP